METLLLYFILPSYLTLLSHLFILYLALLPGINYTPPKLKASELIKLTLVSILYPIGILIIVYALVKATY